jgi:hypothetical protein
MKKLLLLSLGIVAIMLVFASPALAAISDYPTAPATWQRDEIAWKVAPMDEPAWYKFVADVYTRVDDSVLYARFVARPGYAFVDTAIYVVDNDLSLVPHNGGGPIPGHFKPPYGDHSSFAYPYAHTVEYQIPLPGTWTLPIYLLAHAKIAHFDGCGQIDQIETGWATGCTSPDWNYPFGNKWARFFQIPGGDLITYNP